jgi:hypothetical protein
MTEPRDQNAPDSHDPRPGEQSFRHELLRDMCGGECLSLSDIDSRIQYDYRTEPLSTRQSRVITALASLLNEGLAVVGEIVGGSDATVDPWKLPTEDALTRLREIYIAQYDDEDRWGWAIWFALTPEGERAAVQVKGDTS